MKIDWLLIRVKYASFLFFYHVLENCCMWFPWDKSHTHFLCVCVSSVVLKDAIPHNTLLWYNYREGFPLKFSFLQKDVFQKELICHESLP